MSAKKWLWIQAQLTQTEHSAENLRGWLKLEENLCSYWLSKSCDGEGTYCSMWGCHPYQHWCPRQWRDQCPSDHLAREEKDRTREREISVTSLQLTSTSNYKIFLLKTVRSFIQLPQATEIFLPPCMFKSDGDPKTNIRWQRRVCVCVCLSEKNKTLSFSTSAHFSLRGSDVAGGARLRCPRKITHFYF